MVATASARRPGAADGRRRTSQRARAGHTPPLLGLQRTVGNAAVGRLLTAQRATASEFAIRGKFPDSAAHPEVIFFDMNSAALDSDERAKIPPLAVPASLPLTLRGAASEEGAGAVNSAVVDRRIAAVTAALRAEGWTGPATPEPRPTAGAGNIDYRRARSVEVKPGGLPGSEPDCDIVPRGQPNDCGTAPNAFTEALDRAVTMVGDTVTALGTPPTALLEQIFGGSSATTVTAVKDGLNLIKGQLANLRPFAPDHGHRCVNDCDSSCGGGATAYNEHSGTSARMTLCESFMSEPDLDERAAILIHEGSHGTVGLETADNAYQWQRLFAVSSLTGRARLSTARALKNADSFATFVRLVKSPGSVSIGPKAADADTHLGGLSGAAAESVDMAVAFVQQWLVQSSAEVASLHDTMHETITTPKAGPDPWTDDYYEETMRLAARRFGLTAPPAAPKNRDLAAAAGIDDRLSKLEASIDQTLELEKVSTPGTTWGADGGSHVRIGTGFFALTPRGQADLLLRRLVESASWIPAFRRSAYIGLVHDIVAHGDFGAP